jgi:organic radical activating enzyme
MSILALGDDTNVPRLDFELMTGCDHSCGHCYNVWNARPDDPQGGYKRGMLRSEEFLALMSKAVEQTGADHITITGGEPLLRKDAMEIMERACSLVSRVQLITNGSHVPPRRAKRLGELDVNPSSSRSSPPNRSSTIGSRAQTASTRRCVPLWTCATQGSRSRCVSSR